MKLVRISRINSGREPIWGYFTPLIDSVATLHLRLGGSSSWFPAWPPSSLPGDPLLSTPPPCGTTALPSARRCLPPELHGGAQCAAPHNQAGPAAHCGEDSGTSAHHQGLSSCAHHQGLPPLRSLPSASSSRLPRLPSALSDDPGDWLMNDNDNWLTMTTTGRMQP